MNDTTNAAAEMTPPSCAEAKEFSRRRGLPWVEALHMSAGRTFDVVLRYRGTDIGTKTETTKRGRVCQTYYYLPELPDALRID